MRMKSLENSWKGRKNMNADMKWLDNPEVFRVNQLEAHSISVIIRTVVVFLY